MVSPHADRQARNRRSKRHRRLRHLGYASYAEYLRSPAWSDVKRRYRDSELPQECMCGETTVQLHHKTYERVGEEPLTDLAPLCATCHALVHTLERRGQLSLDLAGLVSDERAAAYAIVERKRQERARAEFLTPRQLGRQILVAVGDANERGIDISEPLADFHAALARIDAHRRKTLAAS
jgi:hypothetical protein